MPKSRFTAFNLEELKVLRLSMTGAQFSTKKAEAICTRLCKEMDFTINQLQTIASLDKKYKVKGNANN